MDVLDGGVPPGTRGGQTWGDFPSISPMNLPLRVPYGQEAVEVTLGPVLIFGKGFPTRHLAVRQRRGRDCVRPVIRGGQT